ncbi:esterase-like activity of phytase family protein [Acidipila sp. EB88]|uniref:esterase-like activity of phytase family protein n=1 Tax=Acidipila sp. EB88 TaxID=2305226 RepID=UPI0013159F07|nr:esterase-like activity of phytase family protein [Acidipila sp. EB88]
MNVSAVRRTLVAACLTTCAAMPLHAQTLASFATIPGETPDLSPLNGATAGANTNRLGGFFSDLYYDRFEDVFYGVADRGPGGGTIAYDTRVQKFKLTIDPNTGAAGNFQLLDTIQFTIPAGVTFNGITGPAHFNGIDPTTDPLNGTRTNLGRSHDPEGFVVAPSGHFYVSDEYGPSIFEFRADGTFVRAFTQPKNVLPTLNGQPDYSAIDLVTAGRVANRGYEALAISPDGNTLYAMLQDPMAQEGSCPNGCTQPGLYSRNLRIVRFDVPSGTSNAQFLYPLESISTINERVPNSPFTAAQQGASIGVSSMTMLDNHRIAVDERDNRGLGVGDPLGAATVSTKRVYLIDLDGATDISGISLAGTNTPPAGVQPVSKSLYLDVAATLVSAGIKVPEKIEGLTIGPKLNDGTYAVILGTDNDFSVTQNASGAQFDVCTDLTGNTSQVTLDAGCPTGQHLIPTFYMSFKTGVGQYTQPDPIEQLGLAVLGLDLPAYATAALGYPLYVAETQQSTSQPTACQFLGYFGDEVQLAGQYGLEGTTVTRLAAGTGVATRSLSCGAAQ